MSASSTHFVYEDRARREKARRLADCLERAGSSSADVAELDDEAWRLAAATVGCRPPSDITKRMVADMLRHREHLARLGSEDIFERLAKSEGREEWWRS